MFAILQVEANETDQVTVYPAGVEKILKDVRADDVKIIPVDNKNDFASFVVVATGKSQWHVRNIAQALIYKVKQKQTGARRMLLPSVQGQEGGKWIVIDSGKPTSWPWPSTSNNRKKKRPDTSLVSELSKPTPLVNNLSSHTQKHNVSYATAIKNTKSSNRSSDLGSPALVLDDTCVNDGDFSRHVMGRVKDLNSILNLKMILTKEGFGEIKLSYLGGLWVMIELSNEETKIELLQHTGANSWFHELQVATSNFVSEERIVWVDIEGIPLSVWSHATFFKIGKIYMVRAKELFMWTPCFMEYKDTAYNSDDEDVLEKHNDASVHVREKCHESSTQKANSRAVYSTAKDPIVSEPSSEFSISFHSRKTLNGGSILDVLDDIIKSIALKRTLWEYISVLINRWNGETLVLGDFNEVRSEEERFGLIFNQSSARAFNQFIASPGLLEIKIEGDLNNSKVGVKNSIIDNLVAIKKDLDIGIISDDMLLNRLELSQKLYDLKQSDLKDAAQKAKVKWAIEGDENSKNFHGIINKRRAQLAIRGVFVNGVWHTEPSLVKDSFLDHFANRFKQLASPRLKLNMSLPNCLSSDQTDDLDRNITNDEIRAAVWDFGENKSPEPDGYTFEFFRHFWELIGSEFCAAVNCFFESGSFPRGCNSSFITLIPKNRHILDGPFILNEALAWCKRKKKQALIFKVDFAKAYDFVRWDFLLDALHAFGFGPRWCTWIRGIFSSNMASILVNGSPTVEFPIFCGLKQGDPLAPLLFILVMKTLHISVSRAVNDGVFKGEWSDDNLAILIRILQCFQLASGLKINVQKSQVLGVGVSLDIVNQGASIIGCSVMHAPFKYLGVTWKVKTLFIGGRLTLLKSVLGAVPLYTMSIYKAPKGVLHEMEMIQNSFFNGADSADRKITWVAWDKVLASKKHGGLGVSSYYALNRALLLKWVQVLSLKGFDFLSHCKIRVGNDLNARFWLDTWIMDLPLSIRFPRIYALERIKEVSVAVKWGASSFDESFRRQVRDDIRSYLDDLFLPSSNEATRWVKYVPIKVFSTFSLDASWLNLSSKEFAVVGISIGLMFRRLSSGILGSLLFGCQIMGNTRKKIDEDEEES
nr:RNA-directed DNA polymerase, eukaryota [Tanacetum cinerariifolium]